MDVDAEIEKVQEQAKSLRLEITDWADKAIKEIKDKRQEEVLNGIAGIAEQMSTVLNRISAIESRLSSLEGEET